MSISATIYLCPNCGSLQASDTLVPWHGTGYTPYDQAKICPKCHVVLTLETWNRNIFRASKSDKSKNIFDFSEK